MDLFAKQAVARTVQDEMRQSYLDYAMSVIIGRALPDVRDGLKPVQRRILYAMYELGNEYGKPYKKSARIVGDVIGKYHPHGDTAVYDALVRMVQEFSLRYPLVDGQGNFGSMDGDSAAAMRYTEVRLSKIASELLSDLDKETVETVPNYDGSLTEPRVLPARIPALLVNGSSGIAVGMATSIPPHNMGEVIDALLALIENPDLTAEELMEFVPAPDFPTGGILYGLEGIREAYRTGKGNVQIRARAFIEKTKKGDRESVVVTEIPYQVNKARLLERIAELARDRQIEEIADLRDESDRDGTRVVIELKKDAVAEVVLNNLYKLTQMQVSFGVQLLAIVQNQPRTLTLKQTLEEFLAYRRDVVTKRSLYLLRKAEGRAHILEGLKIALSNLDAVIKLIRASKDPKEAKEGLVKKFALSEIQAQAILDMRLQRLTGLEREKILEELKEVQKEIARLKRILAEEKELLRVIAEEFREIREAYADVRRSQIVPEVRELGIEDLIVDEEMVVTVSHSGYIKRNPISLYRTQRRGGRGKVGMGTKEEDFVSMLFVATMHTYIMFFTNTGRVHWLKVHEIPEAGRAAKGKAIVNLLILSSGERISAILPVREFTEGKFVFMATAKGVVKKTDLMEFSRPRSGGIIALGLNDDDSLIATEITGGEDDVFLPTRQGMSIRFREDDVRAVGRTAVGVRGIALEEEDEVVGMEILRPGGTMLTVTEKGFGKRSAVEEYRVQSRGGKGVITLKVTEKTGAVLGVAQVSEEDDVMLVTDGGKIIRMPVAEIRISARNTQGVRLIGMEENERVASLARLAEKEE
ncbi:MAG: gyrase subunit A, DNA gyrase subunit A protein [Deltaproteobacteria bacterium CSP1-8]|nr:MAG: gyrase subunit A, DNA gyrase subunit A protein [Deltaproteobacteria bacterium CSP1-8]